MNEKRQAMCSEYMLYYATKLISNIVLLSLYSYQVFASHESCLSSEQSDITDMFKLAFLLGLIILSIDFINSTLFSIYFRCKAQKEERESGLITSFTRTMGRTTITLEYDFRIMIGIVSVY